MAGSELSTDAAALPAPAQQSPAGVGVIESTLKTLSGGPGVYRMVDVRGDALYVGKAKNLRRRVVAYTRPERLPMRLRRMIAATVAMEVINTHTEVEALLLESNLIKRLKPRYNVLLRDDKSFPYILVTGDTEWPQLIKYRGAQKAPGEYFGPFANAGAVNRTLHALQRAFPLRSCSDAIFRSRTRPCLQYQIKRCSAPCVGHIDHATYGAIVSQARDFLAGRSSRIQAELSQRMQAASETQAFEAAAELRDRIRALTQIQVHQDINIAGLGEADVIAAHQAADQTCIQVFFFRAGQNFGNRAYFPQHTQEVAPEEVLECFLGQFYANKRPPRTVLVSHRPPSGEIVAEALTTRAGHRVALACPERGAKRKLILHALDNAREALARRFAESASQRRLLEGLARLFGLDGPPGRIEVYDNSHISGTNALGAMIVAGTEGLVTNAYRKFLIKGPLTPGDDYAMMREMLRRRFSRVLKDDPDRVRGMWPDMVLIDGGAGHLSAARAVFADLGIDDVALAAIAKGPDRDAGRERLFLPDRAPLTLPPQDPVLYFLQRLRDEAHRFAIGAHRDRRSRGLRRSTLDAIPGIGAARKRALLHHFGAAQGVAEAGLADLAAVDGISQAVAKKIYGHFHEDL